MNKDINGTLAALIPVLQEDGELVSACETCPIWKKDDEEVQHDNTQK